MFDKLIDKLIEVIELFKFWTVIDVYEQAIVLQLGKYRRTLLPGFHFICPFYIDSVLSDNVVLKTMDMGSQSLTCKDDISIIISSFISYKIVDIKTFLCDVETAEDVMMSSIYGIISRAITQIDSDEVINPIFRSILHDNIKRSIKKYGVSLINFDLKDMTFSKTIRHMMDDLTINIVE